MKQSEPIPLEFTFLQVVNIISIVPSLSVTKELQRRDYDEGLAYLYRRKKHFASQMAKALVWPSENPETFYSTRSDMIYGHFLRHRRGRHL